MHFWTTLQWIIISDSLDLRLWHQSSLGFSTSRLSRTVPSILTQASLATSKLTNKVYSVKSCFLYVVWVSWAATGLSCEQKKKKKKKKKTWSPIFLSMWEPQSVCTSRATSRISQESDRPEILTLCGSDSEQSCILSSAFRLEWSNPSHLSGRI